MPKKKPTKAIIALLALGIVIVYVLLTLERIPPERIRFYDVKLQAPEFIGYHDMILTPEQKRIKIEALRGIPAPCCSDYPISTCCCPCNLAKSVWGLANFLIINKYNAQEIRKYVLDWIRFTNKGGYSGKACYVGRCELPFREDGCGGMKELKI
jgi:hypothetical protein